MNKKEYANKVVEELKNIGVTSKMTVKEIAKNNGVIYTGILFTDEDSSVSPTYYIDEPYSKDETVENLAIKIKDVLDNDTTHKTIDVDFMQDYNNVKDKIFGVLINKELNHDIIDNIPYAQFGDLMLVFRIAVENEKLGVASALINNGMMQTWNVTLSDLIRVVYENTEKLFPMTIENMNNVLVNMLGDDFPKDLETPVMYIVSNSIKLNGAFYLSNKKALLEVGKTLGLEEFNIIPSSVHELIILESNTNKEDVKIQLDMVKEVNDTQLTKDQILSYNIYHFNTKDEELIMLNNNTVIPFLY